MRVYLLLYVLIRIMFVKAVTLLFAIGALLIFLGQGGFVSNVYNRYVIGVIGVIGALAVLAPAYFLRSKDTRKQDARNRLQQIMAAGLLLEGGGRIGLFQLHEYGFPYDKLVHFLVSGGLVFGLAYLMHIYFNHSVGRALIAAVGIMILAGVMWEILERLVDFWFEANTSGVDGRFVSIDTRYDLLLNGIGLFFGGLSFWFSKRLDLYEGRVSVIHK